MNRARYCMAAAALWLALPLTGDRIGYADTILLKSGGVLHGKALREEGRVVVDFGAPGRIFLPEWQVLAVREDSKNDFATSEAEGTPVPAASREPVVVTLKKGIDRYGQGQYIGWRVSSEDDRVVVLELPGGGRLRLLAENVESVEQVGEDDVSPEPAIEPGQEAIRTTHRVTLRNGRKLVGTIIPTGEDEPVKLELGDLGIMVLRRGSVASIEEVEGSYRLPPPAEAATEPATDETEGIPPDRMESIRRQVRRELLRELLDGVIEEKLEDRIDDAVSEARRNVSLEALRARLAPATIAEIEYYADELQRERSRNRVWAEKQLRRVGPAALPFLRPLVDDPFWLTRRAVQRLVRDIGDVRGTPLAIEALDDEDPFVREIAADTLHAVFGRKAAAYRPDASRRVLRRQQEEFRKAWKDVERRLLSEALAQQS